jgi:hypothetical protein
MNIDRASESRMSAMIQQDFPDIAFGTRDGGTVHDKADRRIERIYSNCGGIAILKAGERNFGDGNFKRPA